jgi:hypothetical protein
MAWLVIIVAVAFVIYCPIFKPWFGFRKPPGHQGYWFD